MTTTNFGLHTVDYGVTGWDTIMTTDMEILDAQVPTRITGTLGETVSAYQAVYFKASDSKWYKAKADGFLQGTIAIAIEAGVLNDVIRLHRMGKITNAGWSWSSLGDPIYLDPSTAGSLTQTQPPINAQIVGYAIAATIILVHIQNVPFLKQQATPTAKTTAVTLTIAELLTKIITGTHTAGATAAYTLPTGTLCEGGMTFKVDDCFDWSLINLSAAAIDTITLTAGTGHTIVGNPIVQSAHSTTGGIYGNSAIFRTRKTATNTFVTYRIS